MGSLYDELRDFSNNDAKISAESSIGTIALVIFYGEREREKERGEVGAVERVKNSEE